MATTMDRNLVLLLSSGHTVKIALKPDDLTSEKLGARHMADFLVSLPAVVVTPHSRDPEFVGGIDPRHVVMAYIESVEQATADDDPNDLQRIDAYSPGETL